MEFELPELYIPTPEEVESTAFELFRFMQRCIEQISKLRDAPRRPVPAGVHPAPLYLPALVCTNGVSTVVVEQAILLLEQRGWSAHHQVEPVARLGGRYLVIRKIDR